MTSNAKLIARWAALPVNRVGSRPVSWAGALAMVEATDRDADIMSIQLDELLAQSRERLGGVDDPFAVDLGMHRWLKRSREETYSDWLQWLLEGRSASDIVQLFGLSSAGPTVAQCHVEREYVIPGGRIDLLVSWEGFSLLVEVKTSGAMASHQWESYLSWLGKRAGRVAAVLLAVDEPDVVPDEWQFCSWSSVVTSLRDWSAGGLASSIQMKDVMTLAFVGAVEQNILGLRSSKHSNVPRIVDHLKAWLGGRNHGQR
jgi:hypothetical protein